VKAAAPRDESEGVGEDIAKAVAYLSSRPGVSQVWLFGSAAKGHRLDWRSDLDFAVEGLPASELCVAWSELDQLVDRRVDLVRWEEASESLREAILRWGKRLYAA